MSFACRSWVVEGGAGNEELLARLEPQCALEDALSCYLASTLDEKARARLWKRACDLGVSGGCRSLAALYREASESGADRALEIERRGNDLDRAGCEENDLSSCVALARTDGSEGSAKRALLLALEHCALGDWLGCDFPRIWPMTICQVSRCPLKPRRPYVRRHAGSILASPAAHRRS